MRKLNYTDYADRALELIKQRGEAIKAIRKLSEFWRNDWSDFDGRTLKAQLKDVIEVLNGKMTYKEFHIGNFENLEGLIDEDYKGNS